MPTPMRRGWGTSSVMMVISSSSITWIWHRWSSWHSHVGRASHELLRMRRPSAAGGWRSHAHHWRTMHSRRCSSGMRGAGRHERRHTGVVRGSGWSGNDGGASHGRDWHWGRGGHLTGKGGGGTSRRRGSRGGGCGGYGCTPGPSSRTVARLDRILGHFCTMLLQRYVFRWMYNFRSG